MLVAMRPNHRQQHGLTMIELMIAITIALVLLAALGAMYGSSVKARNDLERSNRQIENGRYSVQLLREDLGLAGFFGELNLIDVGAPPPPGELPDVCVTHLSALPAAVPPAPAVVSMDVVNGGGIVDIFDYLAVSMHMHVQGLDNVVDADLPDCLTGLVREGTDVIAIRRVSTCAAGESGCAAFGASRPYLQASQCDDEVNAETSPKVYFLRADATAAAFNLTRSACDAAAAYADGGGLAPIRGWVTHIYFIANDNVAGDGIPTLKRLEMISTGWTTTALVEGVEDLQLEYGIDADDLDDDGVTEVGEQPDGVPDIYLDDPTAATILAPTATPEGDIVKAWRSVMTVRVHLLTRGTGNPRPGYSDAETYRLANSTSTPATRTADENRYARQVFQTLVQFRNASGRLQ
jgi:type IV pilus assembly protein PilW